MFVVLTAYCENGANKEVRNTKRNQWRMLNALIDIVCLVHWFVSVLQWTLCSISGPKFIHPLQQCRFHCTDLLIQLCQTAGLKDKV